MNIFLIKKLKNKNLFLKYLNYFDKNFYYIIFNVNCMKAIEVNKFNLIFNIIGDILNIKKSLLKKLNIFSSSYNNIFNTIYFNNILLLKIKPQYIKLFLYYFNFYINKKYISVINILYNFNKIKLYKIFIKLITCNIKDNLLKIFNFLFFIFNFFFKIILFIIQKLNFVKH